MSPPPTKERAQPTTRLDALSLFLGVAMASLLLMYGLDAYQSEQLATHDILAAQIPLGELGEMCTAMATGADADEVLIVCAQRTRDEVKTALKSAWRAEPPAPWLKLVALRDASGTTRCDLSLSSCSAYPALDAEAMKASRRRPARQ